MARQLALYSRLQSLSNIKCVKKIVMTKGKKLKEIAAKQEIHGLISLQWKWEMEQSQHSHSKH